MDEVEITRFVEHAYGLRYAFAPYFQPRCRRWVRRMIQGGFTGNGVVKKLHEWTS